METTGLMERQGFARHQPTTEPVQHTAPALSLGSISGTDEVPPERLEAELTVGVEMRLGIGLRLDDVPVLCYLALLYAE